MYTPTYQNYEEAKNIPALSVQAAMTDAESAKLIAEIANRNAEHYGEGLSDGGLRMAINDVWAISAGNLHQFATRLRDWDAVAYEMVEQAR